MPSCDSWGQNYSGPLVNIVMAYRSDRVMFFLSVLVLARAFKKMKYPWNSVITIFTKNGILKRPFETLPFSMTVSLLILSVTLTFPQFLQTRWFIRSRGMKHFHLDAYIAELPTWKSLQESKFFKVDDALQLSVCSALHCCLCSFVAIAA